MSKSGIGPILVLSCFISWGVLPIFWKSMGYIDSTYIMLLRLLWSAVFYGTFVLVQGKYNQVLNILKDRKQCLYLFGTGVVLTLNWWIYIYAIGDGKIIETSLAYYINPIFAVIAGHYIFSENLTKAQWLATLLAAFGIGYSIFAYGHVPWHAILIGASFTLYGALKKQCRIDGDVSLFMESAFIVPFGLALLIFREATGSGYAGTLTAAQYALFPVAGIVTAVPLLLYARGMKTTSLTLSGVLMFINPTLQLIIAMLMYSEKFMPSDKVMFPCVWIALILFVGSDYSVHKSAQKSANASCH